MKKVFLFATATFFSLALLAQNETKTKTKALPTKEQSPTKVKPAVETKPATEVPMTAQTQESQISPDDVIKVNTVEHSFGKIPQGKPVTYSFKITNISNKPVVVENTYASCGCTTPDKIVEPIMPGTTVDLKVQYNAAAVGPINKDVHIKLAGITQEKLVKITGEVLPPEPQKEEKSN